MNRHIYKIAPVGVIILMVAVSLGINIIIILAAPPMYSIAEAIVFWVILIPLLMPMLYVMEYVFGSLFILSLEIANHEAS